MTVVKKQLTIKEKTKVRLTYQIDNVPTAPVQLFKLKLFAKRTKRSGRLNDTRTKVKNWEKELWIPGPGTHHKDISLTAEAAGPGDLEFWMVLTEGTNAPITTNKAMAKYNVAR